MPFECMNLKKLFEKDHHLKQEDIQALKEWVQKQPHLPEMTDLQLALFLHSCYYRLEAAKTTIDTYFTVKTHCSDLLTALSQDDLKRTLTNVFLNILPKRTPEDYHVMMMKIIDPKTENFNFNRAVQAVNMIHMFHVHQFGFEHGGVAVLDLKGFTLGHLARINLMSLKHALYYLQEGMPVRLKSIHFINVVPFIDKVIALIKPFLTNDLYNMLNFHSSSIESLYEYVPKECLPKEYGGAAPSTDKLTVMCLENLINNFDFFAWHDAQKVDESKRSEKSDNININSIFGAEGSFKKLAID